MYMLKGKKYEHQRHINQLRARYTENGIKEQEVPMEVLYDVFDIPASPHQVPYLKGEPAKGREWNLLVRILKGKDIS